MSTFVDTAPLTRRTAATKIGRKFPVSSPGRTTDHQNSSIGLRYMALNKRIEHGEMVGLDLTQAEHELLPTAGLPAQARRIGPHRLARKWCCSAISKKREVLAGHVAGKPTMPRANERGEFSAASSIRSRTLLADVKGVPITQFCDDQGLTPRERLELFIPVCQAIQHARRRGSSTGT